MDKKDVVYVHNGMLCCVYLLKSYLTLCNPWTIAHQTPLSMGILKARIPEWIAMPSSRRSSQPRDHSRSPTLPVDSLPSETPGKSKNTGVGSRSILQGIFPTQKANQGLFHYRQVLYQLNDREM